MVDEAIHPPQTDIAVMVVEVAVVELQGTLIIVVCDILLSCAATTIFLAVCEIHILFVLQCWSLDCLRLHHGKI